MFFKAKRKNSALEGVIFFIFSLSFISRIICSLWLDKLKFVVEFMFLFLSRSKRDRVPFIILSLKFYVCLKKTLKHIK